MKYYITYDKTAPIYLHDKGKTIWTTLKNCVVSIDATTEQEAIKKLYAAAVKCYGDTITNIKISINNPILGGK